MFSDLSFFDDEDESQHPAVPWDETGEPKVRISADLPRQQMMDSRNDFGVPTQKQQQWKNPLPMPDAPDYSRVEEIRRHLDALDSGIAPFLPMQGFQQQQAVKRQQLMQLLDHEQRRADSVYTAQLNNWQRMEAAHERADEARKPRFSGQSSYDEGTGEVVYPYFDPSGMPQAYRVKGQNPAAMRAGSYNARTDALKQKWATDAQLKDSQFQQALAQRESLANMKEGGLNTRFNKGLAYRQAPVDPADKMQWQDLRDEEDDAQHALLQAEKYQDQDLVMRQTHRLAVVNQKQQALLAKVKGGTPAAPTGAASAAPAGNQAPIGTPIVGPDGVRHVKTAQGWDPPL